MAVPTDQGFAISQPTIFRWWKDQRENRTIQNEVQGLIQGHVQRWVLGQKNDIDIGYTNGYTVGIYWRYNIMASIKTAISIEKPVFEQINILAKNLKISRSRLFALAVEEFMQRHKNTELLETLNKVYNDLPESETILPGMRSKHYEMVKDKW